MEVELKENERIDDLEFKNLKNYSRHNRILFWHRCYITF